MSRKTAASRKQRGESGQRQDCRNEQMSNDSMSETSLNNVGDTVIKEPELSPATQSLLFGLSLPERMVRSAVGLTAGAVKELAGFVVPQAFQTSKSYEIAIHNALSFLTETVGGAERKATA